MTDNESITALECCEMQSYPACRERPYHDHYSNRNCISKRNADIKDRIKSLNAENEELKRRNQNLTSDLTSDLTSAKATEKELTEQLNFLEQEYKKLYEKNKKLLLQLCDKKGKASKIVEKIISSKARKELAERLKLIIVLDLCEAIDCSEYLNDILPEKIDNLLAEMESERG